MSDKPIPLLLSTIEKVEGWQVANCDVCGEIVYEHKENIDKVRQMGGWVICIVCAIKAKVDVPSLSIEAQLWHGHFREPQVAEGWGPIVEFLNRKVGK